MFGSFPLFMYGEQVRREQVMSGASLAEKVTQEGRGRWRDPLFVSWHGAAQNVERSVLLITRATSSGGM